MAFEIHRGTFLKYALVKRIEYTTFGNRLEEMGSQKKNLKYYVVSPLNDTPCNVLNGITQLSSKLRG